MVGKRNHGRFYADAWQGSYQVSKVRHSYGDALVANPVHSQFIIEGPGISWTIEARCGVRESVPAVGVAALNGSPMSYRCDFTADGEAIPARLELHEVRSGRTGRERRGEIALGGQTVQIRSVHQLDGTPIEMATPIGYVFEQYGHPVGALTIAGAPRMSSLMPRSRWMMLMSKLL